MSCDAERRGGVLGLLPPRRLDPLERHARLLPELGALAALAVGEADHRDRVALLCVQRDRAAAAPDEVGGVRADDECRPGHGPLPIRSTGGVPWVWKLSIVFRPQAWPFLRSASVQVTVSQSGRRISRAPAFATSTRLPAGSQT